MPLTPRCDVEAYQKSSLSSAERLCKPSISMHPLSPTSLSILQLWTTGPHASHTQGGKQVRMGVKSNRPFFSLCSSTLGVKNLLLKHNTPPIQQLKYSCLCHFSSRKLPLAAVHLRPHDIKCFHIICIFTDRHRAIHFFFLRNGTRGKKK